MANRNSKYEDVHKSRYRRKQSLQRFQHKAFQSIKEALERVFTPRNLDWDTDTPGSFRFVGTSRYIGSWSKTGNKPD